MKQENKCQLCKEKESVTLLWDYYNWIWLCRECQLSVCLQLGFIEDDEVEKSIKIKHKSQTKLNSEDGGN